MDLDYSYIVTKKIKDAMRHPLSLTKRLFLCGMDCLRGASVSTCATVNTCSGVDYILGIAFRDSLRGALINASTALDTVVINYVSHNSIILNNSYKHCKGKAFLHRMFSCPPFFSYIYTQSKQMAVGK